MFFVSVRMRLNFSPARNVLSTTDPADSDFSFVRTNAPPLPGLTCWNSTMRQVWPSTSMCMPLRNWLVETTSAIGGPVYWPGRCPPRLGNGHELLGEGSQHLEPAFAHDGEVLDPDAADALAVDARLNGDD